MSAILCVTLNPTLDLSNDVDRVVATHKMRVRNQRQDVGGGGINVARVVAELGGQAEALVLSGGASGTILEEALKQLPIGLRVFPMKGAVRIAFMVHEEVTNLEYRFVPEGPVVTEAEVQPLLDYIETHPSNYVVASGSLPRGISSETYARMARIASAKEARFVLDASGEPLVAALSQGGIFLFKPSLSELERLVGHSLDIQAAAEVCADLVAREKVEHVALTLGEEGAMLLGSAGQRRMPAIKVPVRSAVGAGDSFVGAMVWALSRGQEMGEAFRFGLAAGAAAVMTPGTELCRRADILKLYAEICALSHEESASAWVGAMPATIPSS
jgi:6-phosphofructokinase 2